MCFIVSMISLALSFNFFIANQYLPAIGSFLVALIFIFMMIRNIMHVRKLKKERKETNDS